MIKVQEALDHFAQGCSCSQSIVMSYGPAWGLTPDIAIRVASAFGGGMARRAETCGAVSGALMVLGMTFDPNAENPKDKVYALAQEFIRRFQERNGFINCKELLGCDISTLEGKNEASQRKLTASICPNLIQQAAEILEELLLKQEIEI